MDVLKLTRKNCLILLLCLYHVTGRPFNTFDVNILKERTVNGKVIRCHTIQCSFNQYFVGCTEDMGFDTCHKCPPGFINKSPINSSGWDYEPKEYFFCQPQDCECPPESVPEKDNDCLTSGDKKCVCNLAENQYGDDFYKCQYFKGICPAGTELNHDGNCRSCKDGYFKRNDGKGLCIQYNTCTPPNQEIDFPGNKTADVTCRPVLKKTSSTLIYPEHNNEHNNDNFVQETLHVTKDPVTKNNPTLNSNNTEVIKKEANDSSNNDKMNSLGLDIGISLGVVAVFFVLIIIAVICCKKHLGGQKSLFSEWSNQYSSIVTNCLGQNSTSGNSPQTQSRSVHYALVPTSQTQDLGVNQVNGYREEQTLNNEMKDTQVQTSFQSEVSEQTCNDDSESTSNNDVKASSKTDNNETNKPVNMVNPLPRQNEPEIGRSDQVANNGASARVLISAAVSSYPIESPLLQPAPDLIPESLNNEEDESEREVLS